MESDTSFQRPTDHGTAAGAGMEESYPLLTIDPAGTRMGESVFPDARNQSVGSTLLSPKVIGVQSRSVASSESLAQKHTLTSNSIPSDAHLNSTIAPFSTFEKLGWLAFLILIFGFVAIFVSVGFLLFLWLADSSNKIWSAIAVHNWFTRAVSLSALVLRSAASLQAATATSMLAGIAMEKTQVLLVQLASISTMRNASSGPYWFTWLMLKAFRSNPSRLRQSLVPLLAILLTVTTLLLQFTSTVLLSDLLPTVIPGSVQVNTIATNFQYDSNNTIPITYRGTVWNRQPPFHPLFAEYHEPPTTEQKGISDTGLTLRAFMPVRDQISRSLLRDYTGRATVVNTQVRCQVPPTTRVYAYYTFGFLGLATFLNGTDDVVATVIPFSYNSDDTPVTNRVVLSDLGVAGTGIVGTSSLASGLDNAFRGSNSNVSAGRTFLAVNISSGSQIDWQRALSLADAEFQSFQGDGQAPLLYSDEDEWRDFWWTKNASLRLSVSICYTGLDSVDIGVNAFTSINVTEPSPTYDPSLRTYDYSSIRNQLGQITSRAIDYNNPTRQIMTLEKRNSWMPDPSLNPSDYLFAGRTISEVSWLNDFFDMGGPWDDTTTTRVQNYNYTTFLTTVTKQTQLWRGLPCITADPSIVALVQEILNNGGGIAFALQSILTVLSGLAYYDQLLQFNGEDNVSEQAFVIATVRKHFRGIIAVLAVVGVHVILVGVILSLFLLTTRVSTVGNAWMSVAQVYGEETRDVLDQGKVWSDGVAGRFLGRGKEMTGVEERKGGGTEIRVHRRTGKASGSENEREKDRNGENQQQQQARFRIRRKPVG